MIKNNLEGIQYIGNGSGLAGGKPSKVREIMSKGPEVDSEQSDPRELRA